MNELGCYCLLQLPSLLCLFRLDVICGITTQLKRFYLWHFFSNAQSTYFNVFADISTVTMGCATCLVSECEQVEDGECMRSNESRYVQVSLTNYICSLSQRENPNVLEDEEWSKTRVEQNGKNDRVATSLFSSVCWNNAVIQRSYPTQKCDLCPETHISHHF